MLVLALEPVEVVPVDVVAVVCSVGVAIGMAEVEVAIVDCEVCEDDVVYLILEIEVAVDATEEVAETTGEDPVPPTTLAPSCDPSAAPAMKD